MTTVNLNFRDALDIVEALGFRQGQTDIIEARCVGYDKGVVFKPTTSYQDTKDKILGSFFAQANSDDQAQFDTDMLAKWWSTGYLYGAEVASR